MGVSVTLISLLQRSVLCKNMFVKRVIADGKKGFSFYGECVIVEFIKKT